ncbi:MAG: LPS export ABC transporter periplasmic protein LptC [Burkholderiales bacterium]
MEPTRRLLDRLTAWSPVLLLAGLAALTYWLDAQVQAPGPDKPAGARHEPDMFIENFRAVNLGADGKPQQTLAAKRAQHYGDDGTSDLVEPRLELAEPGKPRLTLSAERGRVSADRDQAWFAGGVRAVRDAPPGAGADGLPGGRITLTTEELSVATREERLTTDKAVTIEEPRGIIRGVGLEFDNAAKTVRLMSRVSGTLEPSAPPK